MQSFFLINRKIQGEKAKKMSSNFKTFFQAAPDEITKSEMYCIFFITLPVTDFQVYTCTVNITANGSSTELSLNNLFFGWMAPEGNIQHDEENLQVAVNISQTYFNKTWTVQILNSWTLDVLHSFG